MVVAGAPLQLPNHCEAVAEMALDMLEQTRDIVAPNGEPLRVRIGINTGPVVGAVIGSNKFIYDVYGDAVNTASRMESQGLPGSIQVTEITYQLLCDKYVFREAWRALGQGQGRDAHLLAPGARGWLKRSRTHQVSY
jgi:adenylate cyclase